MKSCSGKKTKSKIFTKLRCEADAERKEAERPRRKSADSYGVMITRRSYKDAYGEDYARAELIRCADAQFDPNIVEAFSRVFDNPLEHAQNEANPTPLPDFLPLLDAGV